MSGYTITDAAEASPDKTEPTPGEKGKKRGRPPGSGGTSRKDKFAKEFQSELDALLKMLAMMWSVRDPVCGGVLNNTSQQIAQDIAELAASSTKARKYLEQTMGLGKVVPLLMHLMPLLTTIREHHLTPKTEDHHGGENPVDPARTGLT